MNLNIGDRVYYTGPGSDTINPEYIITEIYKNGSMAKVRHDSGRIHADYMLINMKKYSHDEDTYLFEKAIREKS